MSPLTNSSVGICEIAARVESISTGSSVSSNSGGRPQRYGTANFNPSHFARQSSLFSRATELLRHAEELKKDPAKWMPWNYRETRARLATSGAA